MPDSGLFPSPHIENTCTRGRVLCAWGSIRTDSHCPSKCLAGSYLKRMTRLHIGDTMRKCGLQSYTPFRHS